MTTENQGPEATQQSSNTGTTILIIILVVLAALAVVFLAFLIGGLMGSSASSSTGDEVITGGGGEFLPVPTPASGEPSLTSVANLNIRKGPGTEYESYGLLQPGQTAQAVSVSADGDWYAINFPLVRMGSVGYLPIM